MLIQKIFHIHQPLHETRSRLSAIGSYRRQFDGVDIAFTEADGVTHLKFEPGLGYSITADLVEMQNGAASDGVLFRSIGGNVEMAGMVEFFEINDSLTEVALTVDYQLKSPLARVADALGGVMDRFLNAQLRRIQTHFEGIGTFTSHPAEAMHGVGFAVA